MHLYVYIHKEYVRHVNYHGKFLEIPPQLFLRSHLHLGGGWQSQPALPKSLHTNQAALRIGFFLKEAYVRLIEGKPGGVV